MKKWIELLWTKLKEVFEKLKAVDWKAIDWKAFLSKNWMGLLAGAAVILLLVLIVEMQSVRNSLDVTADAQMTESETMTETESETVTESETTTESETMTESETATESETMTETETPATETATTESETESETESGAESENESETTEETGETDGADVPVWTDVQTVIGTLEYVTAGSITLTSDNGNVITFQTNDAVISLCNGLRTGNLVTVDFTGDFEDPVNHPITVRRIVDSMDKEEFGMTGVDESGDSGKEKTVKGNLMSISMNELTIMTMDGVQMVFSTEKAEYYFTNGMKEGTEVEVTYRAKAKDKTTGNPIAKKISSVL